MPPGSTGRVWASGWVWRYGRSCRRVNAARTWRSDSGSSSRAALGRSDPTAAKISTAASVDISRFPRQAKVVATALKRYGMLLADNGSPWFVSGAPHPRWDNDDLRTLRRLRGADFEVVAPRR